MNLLKKTLKPFKQKIRRSLERIGFLEGPIERKRLMLSNLNLKGLGLELGPSHTPIAPKSEGYHVEVLDYTSQEELIKRYIELGIDHSRIEAVDHVWKGQPFAELVGGTERFDWIIASHVLEHVPNLLGTLLQCQEILKPDGILSIALPDHRQVFDCDRSPSSLGAVIDAHLRHDTKPTPGTITEFDLKYTRKGGRDIWHPWQGGTFEKVNPIEKVISSFEEACTSEAYKDVHVWVFTMQSFTQILEDLIKLNQLDLELTTPPTKRPTEFFIQLRRVT